MDLNCNSMAIKWYMCEELVVESSFSQKYSSGVKSLNVYSFVYLILVLTVDSYVM